jgi:hypothetical protein
MQKRGKCKKRKMQKRGGNSEEGLSRVELLLFYVS